MNLSAHEFISSMFPDYDRSYIPFYEGYWSDFSGCGWIVLFEKNNEYFMIEGGCNPMVKTEEPCWFLENITEDYAIELMLEWDELN